MTIIPRPFVELEEALGDSTLPDSDSPDSALTIGLVGRLDVDKHFELAFEALAPLDVNVALFGARTYGSENYSASLLALGEELLGKRFRYHGAVAPQEIYSAIDVLVITNHKEASGRTVGEAMLAQKLTITPDSGGTNEYTRDGRGIIYRSTDAGDLTRAVSSALTLEPARKAEIIQKARQHILSDRSTERVGQAYAVVLSN